MSINTKIGISAALIIVVALLFAILLPSTSLPTQENEDLANGNKWGFYS
jgi:hypothetical protein